jgi:predicted acetyltransferase
MQTEGLTFTDITRDQLDMVIDVRNRSFGIGSTGPEWRRAAGELIDGRRFVGVLDGDTVVAAARILDFQHWWLGRQVPMAGIAGVVVAPQYRGRGVGSLLMRGVLGRARELGVPLTALYPATVPVYRHLGYEFGGGRYRFSFPAAELRTLGGRDVAIRKGGPDDAGLLLDLVAAIRAGNRESGMLVWPVGRVREWLEDEKTFCYIADDGFVVYSWDDGDLGIDEIVAGSEQTLRALWSVVGSGSSIAKRVHAYVGPHDPIHLLLGKEADIGAQVQRWMLRLVDAPAAIAARGWSPGAALDLPLEIDDAELTANSGSWSLRVATDKAELVRSGSPPGALRLNARGLASLYAGVPLATLRRTGLASDGVTEDDARVDAAFAGPVPYMLDYF